MTEMSQHFNEALHRDHKTNRVVADLRMLDLIDEALAGYDAYREDLDEFTRREFKYDPMPGEVGSVPALASKPVVVNRQVYHASDVQTDLV